MSLPPTPFGRETIESIIPHRPPFLLVDETAPLHGHGAAYGAAFNAYAADALGYRTELAYRVLSPEISRQWNWQGDRRGDGLGLAMSSLETALLQHPATKVLIANGRYDLVTPYLSSRWLVDQLGVPPPLRTGIRLRVYEGGHMMYMRPDSRLLLARDAAELYGAPNAAAPSQ